MFTMMEDLNEHNNQTQDEITGYPQNYNLITVNIHNSEITISSRKIRGIFV